MKRRVGLWYNKKNDPFEEVTVMAQREQAELDLRELERILLAHKNNKGQLVPILQEIQELYGYLPGPALEHIARKTGISLAAVLGVATFYTQFRMTPVGKYLILLCKGTACYVSGFNPIEKAIRDYLGIESGQTTEDGLFTLETVACIGCCCLAPAMRINGRTYGRLTPNYAVSILKELRMKEAGEL